MMNQEQDNKPTPIPFPTPASLQGEPFKVPFSHSKDQIRINLGSGLVVVGPGNPNLNYTPIKGVVGPDQQEIDRLNQLSGREPESLVRRLVTKAAGIVGLGSAAALAYPAATAVAAEQTAPAPYCAPGETPQYRFGNEALYGILGPEIMGKPLECEHYNPNNGDSLQKTSTGLAFYRKATNTPTFTNGNEHWGKIAQDPGDADDPDRDHGFAYWTGESIDPPGIGALPGGTGVEPVETGGAITVSNEKVDRVRGEALVALVKREIPVKVPAEPVTCTSLDALAFSNIKVIDYPPSEIETKDGIAIKGPVEFREQVKKALADIKGLKDPYYYQLVTTNTRSLEVSKQTSNGLNVFFSQLSDGPSRGGVIKDFFIKHGDGTDLGKQGLALAIASGGGGSQWYVNHPERCSLEAKELASTNIDWKSQLEYLLVIERLRVAFVEEYGAHSNFKESAYRNLAIAEDRLDAYNASQSSE